MTDLIQRLRTPLTYGGPTEYFRYMREAADELELFIEWKKVAMEEARCAEKEIERLTRERDVAEARIRRWQNEHDVIEERDRLRAALERIANRRDELDGMTSVDFAREALKGEK
jgi:hypothetical protein